MMQPREWSFGSHRARFEEPDLMLVEFHGPTRLDDAKALIVILDEVAAKQSFYLCCDIADSSIDTAARKYVSDNISKSWLLGLVYVGAGAIQRAMAKAMVLTLYYTGRVDIDIEFVATEADARRLFEVKRRRQASSTESA